ncbi:hypothetical protein [Parafilimonas sp.]|uniref:hypothetical protein n=1 Tax=Parafilimonas sp. TaxID=1969739 RepID=UPI0039E6F216
MLAFFTEKFESDNYYLIVRSLVYFEDADKDQEPKCFFKENWDEIKHYITNEVKKVSF